MNDAKVLIEMRLPHSLVRDFLQHIRDFDIAHAQKPECAIDIEAPLFSTAQIHTIFDSIRPPFPIRYEGKSN
jgi:hypothetical protein